MIKKNIIRGLSYLRRIISKGVIELKPKNKSKGNVLISYLISPFINKNKLLENHAHSNIWECFQIVKIFLEEGFSVDVINWDNKDFLPKKDYKIFIDIHSNMERISPHLNEDCLKILHITGSHWIYQNYKEYQRLLEIQNKKKVTLKPRRIAEPSLGIEYADYATILGNDFTIGTFSYANKLIFKIPISSTMTYDFNEIKNYDACRKNFLWLSSGGSVLRGLDLVLEAFSQMEDYNLTICGPVLDEIDFTDTYYKELFTLKNIKTLGWIDTSSKDFIEIANNNIALVYPSWSEGGGGSIITCMHAGLIPIISYSSSVDVGSFGFQLKEITVSEIKETIKILSQLSVVELRNRSRETWNYARSNHTKESFIMEYTKFVKNILNMN